MKAVHLILPYAAWMALMTCWPGDAVGYAVRGAVTAGLLGWSYFNFYRQGGRFGSLSLRGVGAGLLAGTLVLFLWIMPETLFPEIFAASAASSSPSPYAPQVCGWTLTLTKLAASAFVISVAEELFFRRWLVRFAGFWWMVALFAVEHGERWHVGAITGIIYGLLARRFGLLSAIIAHALTNFLLGLHVIYNSAWQFW